MDKVTQHKALAMGKGPKTGGKRVPAPGYAKGGKIGKAAASTAFKKGGKVGCSNY